MYSITLQNAGGDNVISSGDILGRINFAVPSESDGSAATYIASQIYCQADGSFTSDSNPAGLVLATSSSDSAPATGRLQISSDGHFLPLASGSYDLGSSSFPFKNGYFTSLDIIGGTSTPFEVGDTSSSQPFFFIRSSEFISAGFGRSSAQPNCRLQYYSNPTTSGDYWIQDASRNSYSLTRVVNNIADTSVFKLENGSATFNNSFTFPNTDGFADQVLQTDGDGNVVWADINTGNLIEGTGSLGYVTKWVANNIISTGIIYDNGSRVGIGTIAPTTMLHVQSSTQASAQIQSLSSSASLDIKHNNSGLYGYIGFNNNNNKYSFIQHNGSATASYGGPNALSIYNYAGPVILGASASNTYEQNIVINTDGNVGIGTNAPSEKLDVSGVIKASGGNSSNWNTAYGWGNHAIAGYQSAITGAASTITSNNLTTSRVLMSDGSGKVAVSNITSTELSYLDNVSSNIQTQLNNKQASLTNPVVGTGTANFLPKWSSANALTDSSLLENDNYFIMSKLLFVTSNPYDFLGEFSISPTGYLYVGAIGIHTNRFLANTDEFVLTELSNRTVYNSAQTPVYSFVNNDDVGMYLPGNSGHLAFSTSGIERLRILSDGTVGIGTETPSTKLDVSGVITASGGNSNNWNSAYSWGDHSQSDYLTSISGQNIQDLANVESSFSYPLLADEYTLIYDSDINKFKGTRINLGLIRQGTIPLAGYDSSYLGYYLRMNTNELTVNEQGTNLNFRVEGNGVQSLLFTDAISNSVGIGTSQPAANLHIARPKDATYGNIFIEDTTAMNINVGGSIILGGRHTTAGATARLGGIRGLKANNTDGDYSSVLSLLYNNGTSLVEGFRITPQGNIGIGGIAPPISHKFSIRGNLDANNAIGLMVNPAYGSVATSGNLYNYYSWGALNEYTLQNYYHYFTAQPSLTNGAVINNELCYTATDSTGVLSQRGFYSTINGASSWQLYMGGTARSFINGNLGIGNSNPTSKLSVENGSVVFNSLAGNHDFTVGGDTDVHTLCVDASADSVGIGIATPLSTLHIEKNTIPSIRIQRSAAVGTTSVPAERGHILFSNYNNVYDHIKLISWGRESNFLAGMLGINISNSAGVSSEVLTIDNQSTASTFGLRTYNIPFVTTSGNVIFNETAGNYDFRVEGVSDQNLLFVDASTNGVGIGTNTPNYKLDVVGTGNFSQNLLVNGTPVSVTGHVHSTGDITGFASGVTDTVSTFLVAGTGIDFDYDNSNLTINSYQKNIALFTPHDNNPPSTNYATIDTRNNLMVLDFDDGANNESCIFIGAVPQDVNLASGLYVNVYWAATSATTGQCRWGVEFDQISNIDTDSYDTASEAHSATNGTNGVPTKTSILCTNIDSITSGDFFKVKIYRDSSDTTNDTMVGDSELIAVEIQTVI